MPSRDDPPKDGLSKSDILGLIRNAGDMARAERVADVFARMEEDDAVDEADGLVEESKEPSSRMGDSSSWFAAAADSASDPGANGEQGLIQKREAPTVDLPPDPESDPAGAPSLADPAGATSSGSLSARTTLITTPRYRPTRRPPLGLLLVYDDDQTQAERFRIRQTPFVIGRQDGDLVIGHEKQMSRRHARIDRVQEGETWRWYLGDLRSTNGTFVRTEMAVLEDGVEVLLGGELVRFLDSPTGGGPTLAKVAPSSDEQRVQLTGESHLIGTDTSQCLAFLQSSTFLDPHHFRVERKGGRWRILDLASTNHLWIAITTRYELSDGAMFQIGEQRFSFHLP